MKLPPLPLVDGCLFVDNSSWVENLMTCDRKLEYQSLHRRISAAEKPALNFGSAQHLGLEFRYNRFGSNPVDAAYFNDVAHLFEGFFSDHIVPEGDWRTLNWAIEVNRRYCDKFGVEPFSLLKYDKPIKCPYCDRGEVPNPQGLSIISNTACPWCLGTGKRETMVEISFALPLFIYDGKPQCRDVWQNQPNWTILHDNDWQIPVIYTGRIDLPFSQDGEIFINDFKTTGILGPQIWDSWKRSSQQKGYVWAFRQLTDLPVAGYCITAIRTKEPPQYVLAGKPSAKGKSQSPESWWDESFARQYYRTSDAEIEEWRTNTIHLVETFFWQYSKGYLPQKTPYCTHFGRCPYFDVCCMEPQDRGLYLASPLFVDNTWSPLKTPTQSKQRKHYASHKIK